MKKLLLILGVLASSNVFADATGIYAGGGLGYGMQNLSYQGSNNTQGSPALRGFVGYQFASWIDAELGYTYISQGQNWNNLGPASSTIYDLAFTPGFTLPATPLTFYARLGVDAISPNLNSAFYNQIISNMAANFEWGFGAKFDIPGVNTFVRLEYVNYGGATNNNNSQLSTNPSVVMINAGYVF